MIGFGYALLHQKTTVMSNGAAFVHIQVSAPTTAAPSATAVRDEATQQRRRDRDQLPTDLRDDDVAGAIEQDDEHASRRRSQSDEEHERHEWDRLGDHIGDDEFQRPGDAMEQARGRGVERGDDEWNANCERREHNGADPRWELAQP
jgi:hypothetical protein